MFVLKLASFLGNSDFVNSWQIGLLGILFSGFRGNGPRFAN